MDNSHIGLTESKKFYSRCYQRKVLISKSSSAKLQKEEKPYVAWRMFPTRPTINKIKQLYSSLYEEERISIQSFAYKPS
jgi:hypothetical protein